MAILGPRYYRLHLLLDIGRTLLLPPLLLCVGLKYFSIDLGHAYIPAHMLATVTSIWLRTLCKDAYHEYCARQMGARPIPRLKGNWPGNIDIMLNMLKQFKTSYLGDVYYQLFQEYKTTTLNARLLGMDLVSDNAKSIISARGRERVKESTPYMTCHFYYYRVLLITYSTQLGQIITMDQEHSQYVYSTGFDKFWRGFRQKERMETFLGEGIFNRDEEKWLMHRALARPFFERERIADFDDFEHHASRTLSLIQQRASPSSALSLPQPIEVQDLMSRFALDCASEMLFGQNLDTLSAALPEPGSECGKSCVSGSKEYEGVRGSATYDKWGSFVQSFEMIQEIITRRNRLGWLWKCHELFGDKTMPHVQVINDFLNPIVQRVLEDKARMQKVGIQVDVKDKTFLQHLADHTNDPIVIRDQLLNMLLAARDTTACLLTYVIYFMAMHPDIATRMREEVLRVCGSASRAPSYTDLKQLKYMRAVINETLRVFPPVPVNVRESRPIPFVLPPSDGTFRQEGMSASGPDVYDSRPLYMPSSTGIVTVPILTQRNPALWGPDADEFDPDRWLDPERLKIYNSNPGMYAPFGSGPRTCLGQTLALNESTYFLARLLQNYDTFTFAPEAQPPHSIPPQEWRLREGRQATERIRPAAALTLYIQGGLWMRFGNSDSSGGN